MVRWRAYRDFFTSRTEVHREITEEWLDRYGFKYHGILFGKPRGGNYHWIDNHIVKATRFEGKFTDLVTEMKEIEVFRKWEGEKVRYSYYQLLFCLNHGFKGLRNFTDFVIHMWHWSLQIMEFSKVLVFRDILFLQKLSQFAGRKRPFRPMNLVKRWGGEQISHCWINFRIIAFVLI